MTNLNQEATLALAGGCCCAFLFVVTLGGLFLFWRIRQQNQSSVPAPEPPVMTRDVHALPEAESIEIEFELNPEPEPEPEPSPEPPPDPETVDPDDRPTQPIKTRPPLTPITLPMDGDEDNATVIMDRSNPMGFGDDDEDDNDL
jgi:hypothetical protein